MQEIVANAPAPAPQGEREWNDDPQWVSYVLGFQAVIESIAAKYTQDTALREDCAQQAYIALLHKRPEQVKPYAAWQAGEISQAEWETRLDRYCRNVIRNTVIKYLESITTGPWYHGRTRRSSKGRGRYRIQARYVPMDTLLSLGYEVSDDGQIHQGQGPYRPGWQNPWWRDRDDEEREDRMHPEAT